MEEGKIRQAENLAKLALAATPEFERMYQTLGDIYLEMEAPSENVEDYCRQLDLDNALSHCDLHLRREEVPEGDIYQCPSQRDGDPPDRPGKAEYQFPGEDARGRFFDSSLQDKVNHAVFTLAGKESGFCSMLRGQRLAVRRSGR